MDLGVVNNEVMDYLFQRNTWDVKRVVIWIPE